MADRSNPPSPPERGAKRMVSFGWAQAVTVVGVSLVVVAGLVAWLFLRSADRAVTVVAEAGREALAGIDAVARAFSSGSVETTFLSYATSMSPGAFLQFATLDQVELFERTDRASVLWGQLDLPEVVVEAIAPVQYTYYVDLNAPWHFRLEGSDIYVVAPEIRFNKPAIDSSGLRYRVRESSLLRDEDAPLEALKAGLSEMVEQTARANIELVREIGRRRTEQFIEEWLLRDFGTPATNYHVEVVFADESAEPRPLELGLPELQ